MLACGRVLPGEDEQIPLHAGWRVCATAPHAMASPAELHGGLPWIDAPQLAPAAAVLRQRGEWSLDGEPRRFDAQDWWYEHGFDAPDGVDLKEAILGFDGLATLAEVWLNGERILHSVDMFLAHRVAVGPLLKPRGNALHMVFRSLDQALVKRRPRPRWRAPMVDNQQLRWMRTTLLGRTPGWSPPAAVVGPWRGVWLKVPSSGPQVRDLAMQTRVEGGTGLLRVSCRIEAGPLGSPTESSGVPQVTLCLQREGTTHRAVLRRDRQSGDESGSSQGGGDVLWAGEIAIEQAELWWPHTHGVPALYAARLEISAGSPEPQPFAFDLGHVGFRTVEIDRQEGGFAVHINGVPVFCRGACWTPIDPVTLDASSAAAYARAIAQVREAGMNMIRVGGTMSYEADAFYDECDRQGVLVWQDFMFANMDYPEDPDFVSLVQREARQQMARWQGRPSLAVLCGNSEVEQQAAMFGATRDRWAPALFHETLASEARGMCPDVPYWPSSAHGGAFPHQNDVGTTSYYGVGAYLRSQDDARRSGLRFATESLAFANPPEPPALACMPGGLGARTHHPAWKQRTPRDLGAGWDFEDVRDHYVRELFGVDAARLRYADHDRYLALGRVAVGETMAAAYGEWRRAASPCRGALIWFLRDLWPGAGWGVIDSLGHAKAPYFYLKRALQPVSISLTDEGGNGYFVHVSNDGPEPLQAHVEFKALRQGQVQVGQAQAAIEVPPHSARSWPLLEWFDWFADWSWSYRFGPASAQVIAMALRSGQGDVLSQVHAFPTGMALPLERDLGLHATWAMVEPGIFEVTVTAERFAQAVHFDVDGCMPDDAYFHLCPGDSRQVTLRRVSGAGDALQGAVRALNTDALVTIRPKPAAA